MRLWDFPRLQVAVLLVVVMGQILWLRGRRGRRSWISLGAGLAALAWQVTHFGAYLPIAPKHVATAENCPPERAVSLLNANVLQTNHNYMEVLDFIRRTDADVVLLLETGPEWATVLAPLFDRYKYRAGETVPNTYGMILLSKLPMEARVLHRMQPAVPSIAARVRLRRGDEIDLHALHPEPPIPGNDSGERDAELVLVGREVRRDGRAAVVMGDLNDVAWSRTSRLFREVSGMLDPRAGRGLFPTYNANYPFLRWPLDHAFVTPHFTAVAVDRLADIGSDHFPMLFRLCLSEAAGQRITQPQAAPDTRQEASEMLNEGREARAEEARGE